MDALMDQAGITVATLLVFIRFTAFFAAAPIPGAGTPPLVRVVLAGSLAWAFTQGTGLEGMDLGAPVTAAYSLWVAVVAEVALGLCMGFLLSLALYAFVVAGETGGTHMAIGTPGFMDMGQSSRMTLLGSAFSFIALTIFALSDGLGQMMVFLHQSVAQLPPGRQLTGVGVDGVAVAMLAGREMFALGVQVAAPLIASVFAAQMLLAVLARAIPTMNLFIEGPAMTITTGLFGLVASVHAFKPLVERAFAGRMDQIATWLFT